MAAVANKPLEINTLWGSGNSAEEEHLTHDLLPV